MTINADVTGGKPITIWSQLILGVSVVNPLVAFYDLHERKGEVRFFCSVPENTRDLLYFNVLYFKFNLSPTFYSQQYQLMWILLDYIFILLVEVEKRQISMHNKL
jgi:hypothetical protein